VTSALAIAFALALALALAATALTGGGDPFAWGTRDAFQFVRVDVTASGGTVELVCGR